MGPPVANTLPSYSLHGPGPGVIGNSAVYSDGTTFPLHSDSHHGQPRPAMMGMMPER